MHSPCGNELEENSKGHCRYESRGTAGDDGSRLGAGVVRMEESRRVRRSQCRGLIRRSVEIATPGSDNVQDAMVQVLSCKRFGLDQNHRIKIIISSASKKRRQLSVPSPVRSLGSLPRRQWQHQALSIRASDLSLSYGDAVANLSDFLQRAPGLGARRRQWLLPRNGEARASPSSPPT